MVNFEFFDCHQKEESPSQKRATILPSPVLSNFYGAQKKMQCALESRNSDFQKVLDKGKETLEVRFQEENCCTGVKDSVVSPLAWRNLDYRCAILSFLTIESDELWRIMALPLQNLDCFMSTAQLNVNSQLLASPSQMNQFTAETKMVQKRPVSNGTYSISSLKSRSLPGSNVQWKSPNKVLNYKEIKLNELPSKFSCRNSCFSGYSLMSSDFNSISDIPIGGAKMQEYGNKNSRKKAKKKGNKCKKISCNAVSTETEVLSEESACGSPMSKACCNNDLDHGDGSVSCWTSQEIFLPGIGTNKNDIGETFERIIQSLGTTHSSSSEIVEVGASEVLPCAVQKFNGSCSLRGSEKQPLDKMPGCAHFDGEVDSRERLSASCCNDFSSKEFFDENNISDSLAAGLDDSSASPNLIVLEKESSGIHRLEEQSNPFGDGFSSYHKLARNEVDVKVDVDKAKHDIQGCTGTETHLVLPGNKNTESKIVTRSSRINKSRGGGSLQGRVGKENNRTVWKKVQRNNSGECHAQLEKVSPVCTQFKGIHNPVGVQMPKVKDRKAGNRKQVKNKISGRLKSKHTKEQDNIYHPSQSCSGNKTSSIVIHNQPNEMLDIQSKPYNRKELSSVARSHFQNDFTDHCMNSETFQSSQACLDELRPVKIISNGLNNECQENNNGSSPRSCNSINQSSLSEAQSPIYLPHLFFHSADQVTIGSSFAENSEEANNSKLTLQTCMLGGVENSSLATIPRPDGSSVAYANKQLAECGTSRKSIHGRVMSNSLDPISVITEGGQSHRDVNHDPLEDEYQVQKTCIQEATTPLDRSCELKMAEHFNCKYPCADTFQIDADRMDQAISDVCRAQLASEAVQMATNCPLTEVERFLHLSSPVISQRSEFRRCQICIRNLPSDVMLCSHETPNISLGCLWQWYEKRGSYGLEIKTEGYGNSKRSRSDNTAFCAYFVPFLSAVQLFKSHKSLPEKIANPVIPDFCVSNRKDREPSHCHLPIFSVLFPKPHIDDESILQTSSQFCSSEQCLASEKRSFSEQSIDLKLPGDSELLFEYFEEEQPHQRRPLFDKIQQLIRGDVCPQGKMYGDPTMLGSVALSDLHAGSWFAVAWYPIYRIPDGNFRAAFLTYHSLGHFVCRTSQSKSRDAGCCIVSPVVGLRSYNAQNECWFRPIYNDSAASTGLNPSGILERLRSLEETASLMARAVVKKGNVDSENMHPDYEFFRSRQC